MDMLDNELEQSKTRLVIMAVLFAIISIKYESVTNIPSLVCLGYEVLALLIHISILTHRQNNKTRQVLCLILDISANTLGFIITGEFGAFLIGIYLWVIIGYGLRYGSKMLGYASLLSILGCALAFYYNIYYHSHYALMSGLILTLILVPLYAHKLLSQLNIAKLKAEHATQKAEYASNAKSQFLSHISHEIRTPLNGVICGADLLLNTQLSVEQKYLGHTIKNSADLLLQLVNNVLDLSKVESGKMTVSLGDFSLSELVEKTLSLFDPLVNQKNIKLIYQVDDSIPDYLHSDSLHIKQILVNLLSNAVKFTSQGGVNLRVTLISKNETIANVRFDVIDTGVGIAKESLDKIFESFIQADDTIKFKFGGTGLGTTISKELVGLLGGEIGVSSTLGAGSQFWFELPIAISTNSSIAVSAEQSKLSDITYEEGILSVEAAGNLAKISDYKPKNKKDVHILIADDNDTNLTIAKMILANSGYIVTTATNGEIALDLTERRRFDLMVIDNNMPVMNGLDMIKAHQLFNLGKPRIPIIVLSASTTTETINTYKEIGVDLYLTKPVDITKLQESVANLLEQYRNRKAFKHKEKAEVIGIEQARSKEVKKTIYVDPEALDTLQKFSKNNGLIQRLVTNFGDDTEISVKKILDNLNRKDYQILNDLGHTIAGAASSVGAVRLETLSRALDAVIPTDDFTYVENLCYQIEETFLITRSELEQYIKTKGEPAK